MTQSSIVMGIIHRDEGDFSRSHAPAWECVNLKRIGKDSRLVNLAVDGGNDRAFSLMTNDR